MIILGTTDRGVRGPHQEGWRRRQGLPSAPLCEDRVQTFRGTGPERERPSTGGFETLGAVAFAQPPAPETGPEPLLGLRP
jgi:hypothetical protein